MTVPPRLRPIALAALAVVALALVAFALARGAHGPLVQGLRAGARTAAGNLPDVPVIEEHREADVMRLFRGRPLGSYPAPGWRFMDLSVQPRSIDVRVDGPGGRAARMTLRHADDVVRPAARSASFAVVRDPAGDPGGERALDALVAELARNDDGRFWRTRSAVLTDGSEGGRAVEGAARWLLDGAVLLALLLAVLVAVVWRSLRDEPRAARLALAGVVAAGAAYRLALSVPTTMDVWPYSRLLALPRLLFSGPALAALAARCGWRLHLSDLILTYTLAAGLLAPAALFAHAKALLRDSRAALWAAAVIAVLPAHIRFSHSDTGFIPSAVFASLAFALIAQSLRDPSRAWRLAALAAAPALILVTMEQRALNTMFPALYLAQIWLLQPPEVPRQRRALASLVVALAAAAFILGGFIEKNHDLIGEVLGPRTLLNAARGLVQPSFNTLINVRVTPPALLALALVGLAALARSGRGRLAAFLVAWMAAFYTANAVIVPSAVEMQSRYHLHLAAPFALAAGYGARALVDAVAARWPRSDPRWPAAALAAGLACLPWLHRAYERRADFSDLREYDFVRANRGRVPRGCTVLEHNAPDAPYDLRFGRMGRVLDGAELRNDYHPLLITAPRPTPDADPLVPGVRALLRDPPDCLMFYQGLPCAGVKRPGEPIAPACAALRDAAPMDLVASARFPSRPYDENVSGGVRDQQATIELGLYRVRVDELRARRRRPDGAGPR
jgi:hypothetical protein